MVSDTSCTSVLSTRAWKSDSSTIAVPVASRLTVPRIGPVVPGLEEGGGGGVVEDMEEPIWKVMGCSSGSGGPNGTLEEGALARALDSEGLELAAGTPGGAPGGG